MTDAGVEVEDTGEGPGEPGEVRVLLVEDDVDHALLVKRALPEKEGYRLTHVRTGGQALEVIEREEFDLCLVDYRLPDYEGIQLCQELRKGFEGPVLLVTTVSRESAVQRAFEVGVDDYLVKGPGLVDRLADEVQRHLGDRGP